MKHHLHILGLLAATCSVLHGADVPERKPGTGLAVVPKDAGHPTIDSTTDEQLTARRQASVAGQELPKPMPPQPQGFGLLEMSTPLEGGGEFILLPKDSVIWCPPGLRSHMVSSPSGKFTDWLTFFSANRAWITTMDVTHDQITGKTPLHPDTMERYRKGNLLVVATFQGGPISIPTQTP
ncbi:hypothetical protein OVA24_12545 [Luteolibacter sp. SL250]|uniref:hypothetical protein n=1 Tax=Luteolibacter sp. SL250 TaxID=2995170 RepID=UPI0022712092|nr:hypothetical protein [Luteolibacter sp. SL250]WAC18066.1 hypothetical protein OVA24_12545 [Luteolibacter sp. SL250]